ncbi:hypothetical protein L1049_014160 [Liquidambar formosana]|uniref:AB hydrolase-1 domain-containing protein n=1 Tax=Liquidambar formosana TaxID=63359 RepID=A0AAP0RMW1_LIQFO
MSEADDSDSWRDEFASLADDTGIRYRGAAYGSAASAVVDGGEKEANAGESESVKDQVKEFVKATAEMAVELGKGCRDIARQSLGYDEVYIVRKFGECCDKVFGRLRFLNEYLPEDRDPVHAWSVIFFVFVLAVAALSVNTKHDTSAPLMKKVYLHPPNASLILLPDGRNLSYLEQGVPADRARFSIIAPHSFLSSRLAGIPGLKASLLEEFGVRLVTYDLPGFGESDPHPTRNLESSALDMSLLANAVGVNDKFWVVGHSGAAMFASMVNPYEPSMTKEERYGTWEKWTSRRKLMYFLARRFPRFLAYFYRRGFLSGKHGQIDKWLALSLGKRDIALIKETKFEELWQRNVEESIRQGNAKPFVEEAVLQVTNWGFSLADLKIQKKRRGNGILNWLKSLFSQVEEELTGFLGPIHIWQGMDDRVVPPAMTDFVHRILPETIVHKLPYEGHFTYFYFCDECHRQIFTTLFGTPQGPLSSTMEIDQSPIGGDTEDTEDIMLGNSATN